MKYILDQNEMNEFRELEDLIRDIPNYDHGLTIVENLRQYLETVDRISIQQAANYMHPAEERPHGCHLDPHRNTKKPIPKCKKCPMRDICGNERNGK